MFKGLKKIINEAKDYYGVGLNMAFNDFSNSFNSLFVDREFFDQDFFEELEEKLIELDILPNLAISLTQQIESEIYNKHATRETFQDALVKTITESIKLDRNNKLVLEDDCLNVLLIVGINGVGKTTTISKLANKYKKNYNVELVAADTFRAGAINQLNEWAMRLDVPIIKTHQGHAPSAVIYEGMVSAVKNGRELLICDTAGRLHNQSELMEELAKIHRIIKNYDGIEKVNLKSILVLDGTAGKNTISQAISFNQITDLDGVIVTKMDSNAKVGSIINIAHEITAPIMFLTNGEQIEDIVEFDAEQYLSLLFSEE